MTARYKEHAVIKHCSGTQAGKNTLTLQHLNQPKCIVGGIESGPYMLSESKELILSQFNRKTRRKSWMHLSRFEFCHCFQSFQVSPYIPYKLLHTHVSNDTGPLLT